MLVAVSSFQARRQREIERPADDWFAVQLV
jgi:hypothetical protein